MYPSNEYAVVDSDGYLYTNAQYLIYRQIGSSKTAITPLSTGYHVQYNITGSYSFDSIMKMIYDQRHHNGGRSYSASNYTGKDGLLLCYTRYCGTVVDLRNIKGGYRNPSSLLKDRDEYKEIVLNLCKKLDEIFKKYDA